MNKRAVEWYIFVTLLLLVLSIAIVLAFYFGIFPKIGSTANNALFGPLG
ncbi:MAG: hypothetical protein V1839_00395 [archaeon]